MKPIKPGQPDVGRPDPPGQPVSRPEPRTGGVKHDAQGRAVWSWAADTARLVALSASQVLRKLEHHGLSIKDEDPAARGKSASQQTPRPMPGGAIDPYESRPQARSARAARKSAVAAQAARGGLDRVSGRPRVSAPARASWWQRLFRRG